MRRKDKVSNIELDLIINILQPDKNKIYHNNKTIIYFRIISIFRYAIFKFLSTSLVELAHSQNADTTLNVAENIE